MGLRRLAISNPNANTDTTLFTADNQYLMSVITTNKSASAADISVWIEPSGSSSASQYAYIVYNLPVDGLNSYETFRFAVNQNDVVKIRSSTADLSFQAYGLVQYDVNLGVGISSFNATAPSTPVDGLIWVDADGVISGSDAKPVYVWSASASSWLPFAGGAINTAGNYTWTGTNNFNNLIISASASLSASTSIGDISSTELLYLDGVTSSIQNQLNNKEKTIPLQSTAPLSPSTSDLWVDSTSMQLKVYDGSLWTALGSAVDDSQLIIANQVFR